MYYGLMYYSPSLGLTSEYEVSSGGVDAMAVLSVARVWACNATIHRGEGQSAQERGAAHWGGLQQQTCTKDHVIYLVVTLGIYAGCLIPGGHPWLPGIM